MTTCFRPSSWSICLWSIPMILPTCISSNTAEATKLAMTLLQWPPLLTKNLCRIKLVIQMLCLTTRTLHGILPFGRLSAYAVEHLDIKHRTVKQRDLQFSTVPLSLTGRWTSSSPNLESKSASCSMSVVPVQTSITAPMEPTCVPFAATHTTPRATACETDLTCVLYIHMTPYNPAGWQAALEHCNLSDTFPNLIHNIIHGSPIGNPPPLTSTFLLQNLPSASLYPELIDEELLKELHARQISRPYSIKEAHIIFCGHF